MSLISINFFIFLFILMVVYYIVPKKSRFIVLLIGSIGFYLLSTTPYTIIYLAFSIGSVYFAGKYIAKEDANYKKTVYILTLSLNVSLLVVLKYINGLWATGSRFLLIFGITTPSFFIKLLVPLGMSFYTLQLIGYLTDVYWGISRPEKNIAKLTLFSTYFPSLSSGPILRYERIKEKLFEGHRISYKNITFGMQRILWGLFKKLVIAERMAVIAVPVFTDNNNMYNGVWMWVGIFAAVIQIYADFSGNMDIILGVSECFGVVLPENFKQPFFSLTIQEFWRRWHITLGLWLKDYIMYPVLHSKLWRKLSKFTKKKLGKKAAKKIPMILGMLVLWIAYGIWHTPYPNILATAIWFWLAVTTGQVIGPLAKKLVMIMKINTDCFTWRLFQRFRTIIVYSIGILFFSASSVLRALRMGKSAIMANNYLEIVSGGTSLLSEKALTLIGGSSSARILMVSLVILVFVEVIQNKGIRIREQLENQNLVIRWIVLLGFIISIVLYGVYGPGYNASDFIYAGF